jgi:hypothetical protein
MRTLARNPGNHVASIDNHVLDRTVGFYRL